jgi:hypothetical protein
VQSPRSCISNSFRTRIPYEDSLESSHPPLLIERAYTTIRAFQLEERYKLVCASPPVYLPFYIVRHDR